QHIRPAGKAPTHKYPDTTANRVPIHSISSTFRRQVTTSVCEVLSNKHNYSMHTHSYCPMKWLLHRLHPILHAYQAHYKRRLDYCTTGSTREYVLRQHGLARLPSASEPPYTACSPSNRVR